VTSVSLLCMICYHCGSSVRSWQWHIVLVAIRFIGQKRGVNIPSSLTKRVTVIQWLKRQKITTKTIFGLTSFKPEFGWSVIFTKYRDEISETRSKQTIQDSGFKTTCKPSRRCSTWNGLNWFEAGSYFWLLSARDTHFSNYETTVEVAHLLVPAD